MTEPLVDGGTVAGRPRRSKVLPAAALMVFVTVMIVLLRQRTVPPPAIEFIPTTNVFANVPLPIPDRWIPTKWGWLWRTKAFLFGQPRSVMLESLILRLDATSAGQRQEIFPKTNLQAERDEFRLCVLSEPELRDLRRRLRTVSDLQPETGPRMTTAEGMRSVMSVSQTISTPAGPRTAGAQFSFIARRRNRDTDLTTGALITRVVPTPDDPRGLDVVTNVAAGFRVQIPADGAALLISKDRQHPTAVLITAQWPAKK